MLALAHCAVALVLAEQAEQASKRLQTEKEARQSYLFLQ